MRSWDKAHNDHDSETLRALYAPSVEFYGKTLPNAQVIAAKQQAFERDPSFKQELSGLKVEQMGDKVTATFAKTWFAKGKPRSVGASLQLRLIDGRIVIVKETDVTVAAAEPGAPVTIKCGEQVCGKVCCASFNRYACADDPGDECETATNGEQRLWRCDGPEDCAGGEVCCGLPADRVQVVACTKPEACTGAFKHPRYEMAIPRRRVCHDNADCPRGMTCGKTDDWTTEGLEVCR